MWSVFLAAGCYTICGLADKYAVAKAKLNSREFTFLMAIASAVFMTPFIFIFGYEITWSWQAVVAIILIGACKLLEFFTASAVLKEMSAFELKAWVGLNLFISYFIDIVFMNTTQFSFFRILFICITSAGLFLIARSNNKKINYKKIVFPLIAYLAIKLSYGLIMNEAVAYMDSTPILYFGLILITIVLLPTVSLKKLWTENRKGTIVTVVTKIPNAVGLIAENMALAISLTYYSMIQPIILVALFFIGLIRKEECSKLNIIGGIVSIVGIVGFQFIQ